jgi:hypothetical protein
MSVQSPVSGGMGLRWGRQNVSVSTTSPFGPAATGIPFWSPIPGGVVRDRRGDPRGLSAPRRRTDERGDGGETYCTVPGN